MGRKHIYLPHAQTAIYDSKVKLFLKQGISHQLGRDAVVRFECENSAIDVNIEKYSTSLSTIVLVVLTTANFGGFSNFCRYNTRSQAGKSTGYRPTLKPLKITKWLVINNLQIATNKLNCPKNNFKCRWTWQTFFLFVWIAGLYTGSAKSYGSCPLDKILSNGYLANHCLCFWTTNFIHWLADHWISSCPVDNFIQCFEQPGPGPSTKCSAPVKHVKRSGWRLLWLWH